MPDASTKAAAAESVSLLVVALMSAALVASTASEPSALTLEASM